MGGGDLNLKKSWHPQTIRNVEKVWKAEQKAAAEAKKIDQLKKELNDERAREEMQRYAVDQGIAKKKDERLEWMYSTPGQVNHEEYLLGKLIDKKVDPLSQKEEQDVQIPGGSFANESSASNTNDLAAKVREDPLLMIKKKEEEKKKELLNNPVRMKHLQLMLRASMQEKEGSKKDKKKKKKKDKKEKRKQKESRHNSSSESEDDHDHSSRRDKHREVSSRSPSPPKKQKKDERTNRKNHHRHKSPQLSDRHQHKHSNHHRVDHQQNRTRSRSPIDHKKYNDSYDRHSKRTTNHQRDRSKSNSPRHHQHTKERSPSPSHIHDRSPSPQLHRPLVERRISHTRDRSPAQRNNRDRSPDQRRNRDRSPGQRDSGRSMSSFNKKRRSNSPQPRKRGSNITRKLNAEELEKRRAEMMGNAQWRDEQRKHNVMKHREEEAREDQEHEKNHKRAAEFLQPMKLQSFSSNATSSVQDRIKRNINSVQRTPAALENFLKK